MHKDIFPELAKLSGGKKQAWINSNRDLIVALHNHLGFDETAQVLHMKPDTLSNALQRSEKKYRPAITMAEKALIRADQGNLKVGQAMGELAVQAKVMQEHMATDEHRWEHLSEFFQLQSRAYAMMAELVKSVPDFTYDIGSAYKHKVGLTKRNSRVRLSHFSGQGRKQLPRPEVKGIPKHRTPLRQRWPGV